MNKYNCQRCGKLIPEDKGITCLNGYWVCDTDTCRTLDEDNHAHMILATKDNIPRVIIPTDITKLKHQIWALESILREEEDEHSREIQTQALKDLKAKYEEIIGSAH